MIIEILQILDSLANGNIHLLYIYFMMFVAIPLYTIKRSSEKYKLRCDGPSLKSTVIIPVHLEDHGTFEKCLNSVSSQRPDQLIVSMDSGDIGLVNIAKKYGAEILESNTRVGKRKALADAWLKAKNDIVIHIDSDTVLDDNCLEEMTRPFNDPKVAGVSTNHSCIRDGSIISHIFSSSIELGRSINDKALNGNLIVVDGKCSAWRKGLLLKIRDKFLNEYWMNSKCEIGDDRFLSREALKYGYNTIFCESAKIWTHSQKSFTNFLKQQIRWRRSGTKFWIKDLSEKVYPSRLYMYKCLTYYMAPIIFPLVVLFDILLFRTDLILNMSQNILTTMLTIIITIVIGTTLIAILGQLIYFGKILYPKYVILQGLLGLFVILPISVYGALTVGRQDTWMTRKYRTYDR